MRKRLSQDALEYFRREGARGGKVAAARMTPAARRARAMKGAAARTAKKKAL